MRAPRSSTFDSSLTAKWTFQAGSNGVDRGVAAAFLPNDDVVVTGYFITSINFGDGIFHASAGGSDIMLIHLDGTTGLLKDPTPGASWRTYGTPSNEQPADLAIVRSGPHAGAIYLAGSTLDDDGIDVGGGTLTAGHGLFMAKYESFGVHEWSSSAGESIATLTQLERIRLTPSGAPLLTGLGGTVAPDWGTGPLNVHYVVRFDP